MVLSPSWAGFGTLENAAKVIDACRRIGFSVYSGLFGPGLHTQNQFMSLPGFVRELRTDTEDVARQKMDLPVTRMDRTSKLCGCVAKTKAPDLDRQFPAIWVTSV